MDSIETTEPVEAPAPVEPAPSAQDLAIEDWWVRWFCNIGLPVNLYNRFAEAKHDLRRVLAGNPQEK